MLLLTKTKHTVRRGSAAFRVRKDEVLFIHARKLATIAIQNDRALSYKDTEKAVNIFHSWKRDKDAYENILGFGDSATLDEIVKHSYVLTPNRYVLKPNRYVLKPNRYVLKPNRYVGASEVEDDGALFAEKMEGLSLDLTTQFPESNKPQAA